MKSRIIRRSRPVLRCEELEGLFLGAHGATGSCPGRQSLRQQDLGGSTGGPLRQVACQALALLVPGGPARIVGTYSRSWMRPSKVRLLIISSATSG